MKISAMADTSDLRKRLQEFGRIVGVETGEAVRQFARKACVELATETQPFGNKKPHAIKGEKAVRAGINKVYYKATGNKFRGEATNIVRGFYKKTNYPNGRTHTEKFEERLKRYQRANNTGAIAGIAADLGFRKALFGSFDESLHKKARDNKGRVPDSTEPTLLIEAGAEKGLDKYVEKTLKKVGLTKAGWAVCAEKIPLKQAQSATRGIPQWVTRNKGRATGHIRDESNNTNNPKVTMTNSTPWCSQVLTPQAAQKALHLTRRNFVKYMNTTIKKTLTKQAKFAAA